MNLYHFGQSVSSPTPLTAQCVFPFGAILRGYSIELAVQGSAGAGYQIAYAAILLGGAMIFNTGTSSPVANNVLGMIYVSFLRFAATDPVSMCSRGKEVMGLDLKIPSRSIVGLYVNAGLTTTSIGEVTLYCD